MIKVARLSLSAVATCVIVIGVVGCTAPATPVATPGAQSAEQVNAEALDNAWEMVTSQYPAATRPDASTIRTVDLSEVSVVLADCMVAAGFPGVTATPDGGVESGDVPIAQGEAYAVAMYVCQASYPLDPKYNAPLTDAQLGLLYDYFVSTLKPCLEDHGFQVPGAPSKQQFLDDYLKNGGWDIYGNVAQSVDQDRWYAVNQDCPQRPDNLFG